MFPSASDLYYAYLTDRSRVYYATCSKDSLGKLPHSPITRLIQGVYSLAPYEARRILRQRIFSNVPTLTPMDYGMVKVSAKRLTLGHTEDFSKTMSEAEVIRVPDLLPSVDSWVGHFIHSLDKLKISGDQQWMKKAFELQTRIPLVSPRYFSDRPVACLLVGTDSSGSQSGEKLLAASVNRNAENRTLHAEVSLVQSYLAQSGGLLPKKAKIYVTLKCCRMCAGMLWNSVDNPGDLKVFYGKDDPGTHAKETILSAGTPDRLRFSTSEQQCELPMFIS